MKYPTPESLPVVLMVYNRPDHTQQVLLALKQHRVTNLRIYCDGAKSPEHETAVNKTRELVQNIDWITPEVIFRDSNYGLAKSIVAAVNEVFQEEEFLILFEDDCVPQEYFFEFMHECYVRYRGNDRVAGISGYSVDLGEDVRSQLKDDLYFYPRIGSWGWGTWKESWGHYGADLSALISESQREGIDLEQGGSDILESLNLLLQDKLKDVWTLNWVLSVYNQKKYYIYPKYSHIQNIGMDGSGVHCGPTEMFQSPSAPSKPQKYPETVTINRDAYLKMRSYYDVSGGSPAIEAFTKLTAELENFSSDQSETISTTKKGMQEYTVLHVMQWLSLGGAGRAMISTAKYASQKGNCRHEVFSFLPPDPEAVQFARSEGMHVHETQSREDLFTAIERADIVQLEWWNSAEMYDFMMSDLPPCRLTAWFHVGGHKEPQVLTDELLEFLDFLIPCSPFTFYAPAITEYIQRYGSDNVRIAYGAADFARLRDYQKNPQNNFTVGYIGTVDYLKMHPRFAEMSLAIDIPDVKFVLCGDGAARHDIERKALTAGKQDSFTFTGQVAEILPHLEKFDVFGYPLCEETYAAAEVVIQEVMYVGVPPVVFPYGGVKYLVQDNFNGVVVHSAKQYREAIEWLYNSPSERKRISENAMRYARDVFGAEIASEQLLKAYDSMLSMEKTTRKWGLSRKRLLLNDTLRIEDIFKREAHGASGHEIFLTSLGKSHNEIFSRSITAKSPTEIHQIDSEIAGSSLLLRLTVTNQYLRRFPEDRYLHFWAGLMLQHEGQNDEARQHYQMAERLGMDLSRLAAHLESL